MLFLEVIRHYVKRRNTIIENKELRKINILKSTFIYSCIGLYLFHSTSARADHPTIAFGSEGVGAINTISATSLPVATWGFGVRSEIINNDAFSTEQLENFAASGLKGVHSVDKITSTSFSLSYGATENVSISARLPYVKRENIREGELEGGMPEAHTHGDSSGVGDLLLLGQYMVQQRANFNAAILLGVKAPTGETAVRDDDNIRFETEFQPGTGSWDFLLGASVSKSSGNLGYHANVLYNKTTEGSQSTKIADAIAYNTALTYRLNNHATHNHHHDNANNTGGLKWDFSLELNGDTRRKNKIAGISENNSGGTTIYISPGFRVSSEKLSGFIAYGIPVVENQNGTQTDVDSRIVAGVSLAL